MHLSSLTRCIGLSCVRLTRRTVYQISS